MIHYDLVGKGPAVVLLHGFLEDRRMWKLISDDLAADHCVLSIDLPGHGGSDCLNYMHSMEDMAEVIRNVLEKESIENPVIIGHSMGGYAALAYAEKFGVELSGLGLFHSTGYPDSDKKKDDRKRAIDAAMKRPDLFAEMTIPNLFNQNRIEELKHEVNSFVEMAKSQPVQGIVANIRGMMQRPDRTEVFRNLACPKLFVHGVNDPVLDNSLAQKQCEGVEGLTSEFMENVGHMGHLEAPEDTIRFFKKFIKTCVHG